MTENEMLVIVSDMLERKLQLVYDRMKMIELIQENEMLPRLRNIEASYVGTYRRYQMGVEQIEQIEQMQSDISIIKNVLCEHSEKFQKMA